MKQRPVRVSFLLVSINLFLLLSSSLYAQDPFVKIIFSDRAASKGVGWADYDNDGYPDLYVTNGAQGYKQQNFLYHNNGDGTFTRITSGPQSTDQFISGGCSWGDFDNDGDLDLYVATTVDNFNDPNKNNFLYENNGDGTFSKNTTAGPPVDDKEYTATVGWGDYNNDGLVDLFIKNGYVSKQANSLYSNDGDGTFTDITGIDLVSTTYGTFISTFAWGDYNNDGWLDLCVAGGAGPNNAIWRNDGNNTFVRLVDGSGNSILEASDSSGPSWADYDNDGDLDLFITNFGDAGPEKNFLYRNDGNDTFTKIVDGDIVNETAYSYGSAWGDIDNDGDLDLFVGNDDDGSQTWKNFLYMNNGDGTFTKNTTSVALDSTFTYGVAFADYNKDGFLDLFTAREGKSILFKNNEPANGNTNHWINIKCVGTTSNKAGIGAKVRARATINSQVVWQMREISAQSGYGGHDDLRAHFGLADAATIDELRVEWPSGNVQTLTDVAANQFLTITESGSAESIRLTAPNGGETWQVGSVHNITWTSSNTSGQIDLEYSTNGGTNWSVISSNETDDGSYSWTIPDAPSTNCLVRITDADGDPSDVSDNVFTIAEVTYTLTMAVDPPGTGTTQPPVGDHNYTAGTVVTVIATPITGYEFVNWTGDVADPNNDTTTVTMTTNKVVTANFVQRTATLTMAVNPAEGGTTDPTPGDHLYPTGQVVTIIAIPETNYQFLNWTGEVADPNNDTTTVTMNTNKTITANFQTIPPIITVTAPNGGEDWEVGSVHHITWTSQNTSGMVKLEYSVNSGTSWNEIVASTPDDGIFEWTIPDDPSNNCLVKVADTDGNPSDQSNATFTISLAPAIVVTAPNGGEDWEVLSEHAITWTSTKTSGTVKIEYSTDNGAVWQPIIASTTDDGSYSWTIPDDPSTTCLVQVTDADGSPSDASDAVFTISPLPFITVTSPNGGESWSPGAVQNITWNSLKTSGTVKIDYSTDNGSNWKSLIASTADDGVYEWTIPDDPSVNCLVKVMDTDGTPSDQSDGVFTITPIYYNLTMAVSPAAGGTTDPAVGVHPFPKGTVVDISATPAIGYQFDNWSGDVADVNNDTTTVTMTADQAVTANFSLIPITDSHASIVGENILLEWSPSLAATIYNVYRDTVFNFLPDTVNGTNRIGFHVSDEDPGKDGIQWTDTGNGVDIVGDVNKNYFYQVTAVAEVESAPSNVAGEFDYNLLTTSSTDINEIVVIMNTKNTGTPITTAEELAQAIPNCTDVFYWDAAGQGSVGHVKGLPFNNFPIFPGHPYMVNVTSDTIWSLAGSYVDTSFNLITTAGTDINHIGVPLSKAFLTDAEQLAQDIPGCTDVFYWDAPGQGTVGHVLGLPFNNFPVRAGYPYYVNVTSPTVWPASGGSLLKTANSNSNTKLSNRGDIPHTVYGKLSVPDKLFGHANQLQIRAWIVGRPEDVLTNEHIGVGCDENYWWIGVSNFESNWAVGESLKVDIVAAELGLRGSATFILSDAGSDNGGVIRLSQAENEPQMAVGELPQEFALQSNYPNPFNAETTISFGLPRAGRVKIQIFDLAGRWIRTVMDSDRGPGYHQVSWNGRDEQGLPVSSGVYLCRMAVADYRATLKLVLIK